MLKVLVEASLRRRGVVLAITVLVLGYALGTIAGAKLEVLPELTRPRILIGTEAPGLPPEDVETLVTRQVEQSLNGTDGLQSTSSRSIQGLSVVSAEFREGTDLAGARQRVSEGLARVAREMPVGVESPVLTTLDPGTTLVMGLGLTSEERSPMDVRTLAHWTVEPRLLAVRGVAGVVELGGEIRQVQVQVRPEAMARHGLSPAQVVEATRRAIGSGGTGFVETANQRIPLRVEGHSASAVELGELLAAPGVRLREVARIVDAAAPGIGDAAINGEPGVVLLVLGQQGQSTRELSAALDAALEDLRPRLEREGVKLHPDLFRAAGIMEASLPALTLSFLVGCGLIAVVLAAFFLEARATFVSLLAMLLPLLTAAAILSASGASLNAFTLGGLALALAGVADDAITDVENIFRRLRENRSRGSPESHLAVVLSASTEVRGQVMLAALVGALVFLPVITAPGAAGAFFAPVGVAYMLAVLASLVVALTVTPAVCLLLARAPGGGRTAHLRRLTAAHHRVLTTLARAPGGVFAAAAALTVLAAFSLSFLGARLVPEFRDDHLIVRMSMTPGTSASESMRLGRKVSKELLGHPLVRSVFLRVGRTDLAGDTAGTEQGELIVALKGEGDALAVRDDVRRMLAALPGGKFTIKSLLEDRLEEVVSGRRAEVTVRIFGDDLDLLDAAAEDVEAVLASIPGAAGVQSRHEREPRVLIRLRKEKLKHLGFKPVEVLDAVRTSFQGTVVARVQDHNQAFDVVVILDEEDRKDPEGVGSLLLWSDTGTKVPLREVADVFLSTGRHSVLHEGSRRYEEVSCDIVARESGAFLRDAESRMASVKLPPSVHASLVGANGGIAWTRRDMLLHSALAAAGILLLLALAVKRLPNLLCVLAAIPFALSGGVLAILATGGSLSVGSLVGFVAVLAIITRSSILLIARYERLVDVEKMPWSLENVLGGASERLVPVLMTACVTALGLLPLVLDSGRLGPGIHRPMAIVILGGLVTSTIMSLLVLPLVLLRHGRFDEPAGVEATAGPEPLSR